MTKSVDTELSQPEGISNKAPKTLARTRTLLLALLGFGAADLLILNLWAVPKLLTPGGITTDLRAAQSGEPEGSLQPQAAVGPGILRPKSAAEAEAEAQARADSEAVAQLEDQDGHAEAVADPQPQAAEAQPEEQPAEAQAPAEAEPSEAAAELEENAVAMRQALRRAAPPEPSAPPEHRGPAFQQTTGEVVPGAAPPEPAETSGPVDLTLLTPYAIRTAQRSVRVVLESGDPALASGPFAQLGQNDQPLTQIYFSVGNFWLGPNGKVVLERMLPQLTADERPILIVGVADPSGPEQVNDKLSDARAQSVAEWMLAHGVDASRIQTRAIGHEGAVGNALDRRVDIWLGGSR